MEKIGDLRRDEKFSRKTVKGFTLIEMLIVIAIIGILAGMTSLVVSGFVNTTRRESANTSARLVYTSMQNALIQAEVKQEDNAFNANYVGFDGKPADDAVLYAIVIARVEGGQIMPDKQLSISSYYSSGVSSATFKPNTVWDFSKGKRKDTITDPTKAAYHMAEAYKFLAKYFAANLGPEFTGTCQIYVDYANYTVDSVVFNERTDQDITFLNNWYIKGGTAEANKLTIMPGTQNVFTQRDSIKREGIYYGCYPLLDDIGVYKTDYSLSEDKYDIKNLN